MNAEQRAKFEAWATRKLVDSPLLSPLKTNADGEYLWPVAQNMVDAWQACCDANAIDQPADDERERLRDLLRRCLAHVEQYDNLRTEIEAALAKWDERA